MIFAKLKSMFLIGFGDSPMPLSDQHQELLEVQISQQNAKNLPFLVRKDYYQMFQRQKNHLV